VDTVREPLLVLNGDLGVIAASRSFYQRFRVSSHEVIGRSIFGLVDGQLNLPALRTLLETVANTHSFVDGFEAEARLPGLGKRALILNAREVFDESAGLRTILLAFEDVTERRVIEDEKAALLEQTEELLRQKDVFLQEIQRSQQFADHRQYLDDESTSGDFGGNSRTSGGRPSTGHVSRNGSTAYFRSGPRSPD
jgi:hypothetical protein